MTMIQLFISFFQVGLLSFGGGYASLPLIQQEIVEVQKWLSMTEFLDIVTISQMTPGPIGINAATFVGTRVAGMAGALSATLGFISPSLIIIIVLVFLYQKYRSLTVVQALLNGLRPAVIALIASSALTIILVALFTSSSLSIQLKNIQISNLVIMIVAFYLLRFRKMDSIAVLAISGLLSLVLYVLS
jgi:chromate transporter